MARFEDAGHLPKVRGDRGADPADLPRQRSGTTPQMHGRYPDYDILSQADHWDDVTRRVVEQRLQPVGELRWFDDDEATTLRAFCDVVLFQTNEPRIDVLAFVDDLLARRQGAGFRYAGLPPDGEVWRRAALGLDRAAAAHPTLVALGLQDVPPGSFAQLDDDARREVVEQFADGKLSGGPWREMAIDLAWKVVMRGVLAGFYSHPWAWNEIGFGGPAYPRGYARLGVNNHESWEGLEALDVDPRVDEHERGQE